jgi:hypothetical protein
MPAESHAATRNLPATTVDLSEIPVNLVESIHNPVASALKEPAWSRRPGCGFEGTGLRLPEDSCLSTME